MNGVYDVNNEAHGIKVGPSPAGGAGGGAGGAGGGGGGGGSKCC